MTSGMSFFFFTLQRGDYNRVMTKMEREMADLNETMWCEWLAETLTAAYPKDDPIEEVSMDEVE